MSRPVQAVRALRGRLRGLLREGRSAVEAARTPRPAARVGVSLRRGLALRGTVWTGGYADPFDGVVLLDAGGRIDRIGPLDAVEVPPGVRMLGGPGAWIGPGVTDAHVHLALGDAEAMVRGGVLGVRDLGAPAARARAWRGTVGPLRIVGSGPILTAPGGYPSRSWGADGFSETVTDADSAYAAVRAAAALGATVVKVALEPGPGWPVPSPAVIRSVVEAAHDRDLPVVAHALSVAMVTRALDAGVDQLAHTPTELLPEALCERIAAQDVVVCSTIQTFFSGGIGVDVGRNAAALVRAGVRLVYGTDLGNAGTTAGVDPRELDRLARAGLGRLGALRAATLEAAHAVGFPEEHAVLRRGRVARLDLLHDDPLVEPGVWRHPVAVVSAGRLLVPDESPGGAAGGRSTGGSAAPDPVSGTVGRR